VITFVMMVFAMFMAILGMQVVSASLTEIQAGPTAAYNVFPRSRLSLVPPQSAAECALAALVVFQQYCTGPGRDRSVDPYRPR
jgi:hypothetical protein